ncbi:MAG TPA: hypothetical protein P5060_00610 [Candidatus Absconditabacterales bacterium]|nr:hypothetical protein [Candidatus Absconditabacterales bacterium]
MKTLAIETSCDDTSIGIINFDGNIFSVDQLLAYSQVKEHNEFGGVVPEIASRLHSEKIIAVLNQIGRDKIREVDNICVTSHPGLPGSLVVGKTVAAQLGEYFDKPVIHVDHIIGHIFALFLDRDMHGIKFPMIILTASGGHNNIYYVTTSKRNNDSTTQTNVETLKRGDAESIHHRGDYKITKIGQTLDDAAGECFDKVSRMLGGPYPGGVRISQQASKGKANKKFELNRIRLSNDKFEFSFSGIKSQINQLLNNYNLETLTDGEIQDIAYEFQESIVEVLGKKLARAAIKYNAQSIGLSGGVSANDRLRQYIQELIDNKQWIKNQQENIPLLKEEKEDLNFKPQLLIPNKKIYCTDNAAMIGVAGLLKEKQDK